LRDKIASEPANACVCCSGAQKLVAKIKEYNPKIAVFNGKGIYEVFSGQKEFIFGKQPDKITDTDTVSRQNSLS
jgi:mismatch-specific thymine-DNA glycosylase